MKSYSSNCTLPSTGESFVSSPNVRGTLDIAWSCLSVLVICTWSVLHLNVPVQSECKSKLHRVHRAAFRATTKLKWMLFNLLAPEWSLAKAWADSRSVAFVQDGFRKLAETDEVHWEKCHSHFANLGGFVIDFAAVATSSYDGALPCRDSMVREGSIPTVESLSRNGSIPEESIPMTEYPVDGDTLSNEEPDQPRMPLLHASSEITIDRIDPQTGERDRDQAIDSALEQPRTISQNTSRSTVETGHAAPGEALNAGDLSRHDADDDRSLPRRVQRGLSITKRRYPIESIPRYARRMSFFIGPIEWMPYKPNILAVRQSYTEVERDHFQSPWEETRFLRTHVHWIHNVLALQGDRWVVDANQLLLARELGIIDRLPSLSTEEIEDRSKADVLVKSIALGQIAWFLVQVITRLGQGIATSPLEIMTFAFAVSTAFAYFLLLDTPKDVGASVVLLAARNATPQEISRLAVAGPTTYWLMRTGIWIPNTAVHAVANHAFHRNLAYGATFSIVIFGAIHCVAWNFAFPTDIEHVLWQVSAIITATAIPAVTFVGRASNSILRRFDQSFVPIAPPRSVRLLRGSFVIIALITFFAARLFVLVEVVRSLAYLPKDAFTTTWPDNFPHIG